MSTWSLENKFIRLKIDNTGRGLSIRSLYDKENDHEWVYVQKEGLSEEGIYDSVYNGGFEFLFPTDEPCQVGKLKYQDHGFLWTTLFKTSGIEKVNSKQRLVFEGKVREMDTGVRIELSMKDDSKTVHSEITFENYNETPIPYIFRLHPSIELKENSRVRLDGKNIEFEFEGNKPKACDFEEVRAAGFPYIQHERGKLDLRNLGKSDIKEIYCHIEQESGNFEIEENDRKLLVTYDHCKLPILTLYFFNNGHKVVILEPATSGASNVSKFPDGERMALLCGKAEFTFDFTVV